MGLFAALLPSLIGGVASLFKGKKTKYANQMTPQQQQAYNSILQMLQRQAGGGSAGYQPTSDALSMLYRQFLPGMNYTPSSGAYRMPNTGPITPYQARQPQQPV
jgi:hypothetical protein